MSRIFEPAQQVTSWRRLAPHVWDRPHDPTVYGVMDLVVDRALARAARAGGDAGHARRTAGPRHRFRQTFADHDRQPRSTTSSTARASSSGTSSWRKCPAVVVTTLACGSASRWRASARPRIGSRSPHTIATGPRYAVTNAPMRAINDRLGYEPRPAWIRVEGPLDDVEAALAASRG